MSPRPDVSEERRNQIMEAALAVFARLGFQQARMDDIAHEVGLSKGALYLYYKSKDAIIAGLLKYFFTRELEHLRTFAATDYRGSVYSQLMMLSHQLGDSMQWMESFMPIAFEFYAIAGRDQEVQQFLSEYYTIYRGELARLIQRGIENGEFRAVDSQVAATSLVALYEGLSLLFFVSKEARLWTEQIEQATSLLLAGLRNPTLS